MSAFDTERRYRHTLFKGGYEAIRFRPDGSVFVRMLVNGEAIIANGAHQRNRLIKITLDQRPKKTFYFREAPDGRLIGVNNSLRWEQI